MKQFLRPIGVLLLFSATVSSCTTLKSYERQYVSDPEMSMSASSCIKFQQYVHAIREGALIASGAKGNGGCGCN